MQPAPQAPAQKPDTRSERRGNGLAIVALLLGAAGVAVGGWGVWQVRHLQDTPSHEVQVQVGSYQRKQISFDSTGPIDDEGRFLYRVSGVVRDSNTTIEHTDDKRYNTSFRYGQFDSPFEYDKLRYIYTEARKLQIAE